MISSTLFAQDTIYMKSKKQIVSKVVEIGLTEIKFKDINNIDGPVIVIRKASVEKIRYANGSEFLVTQDPYAVNKEESILNKSNVVKFEFMSHLGFGFEHMLKIGMNLETKIGIIGPGISENTDNVSGMYVKAGIKFMTGKDVVIDGMRYAHQLRGFYIKPELIFNQFTLTTQRYYFPYYYSSSEKITVTNFAMDIVFGKQFILGNIMTLDIYAGLGYGSQNIKPKSNYINEYENYVTSCYSHTFGGNDSPVVTSGGISLGVIF
jgi:hypothetical protein